MTTSPTGYRMRIAIASPEIEARIRDVFATRGLDVVLDDVPPTFEVTVRPGTGAHPAPTAVGDALHHLVGPAPRTTAASAHYRLTLAAAARDTAPPPVRAGTGGVAELSEREQQVMACMARGLRNPQIADELGVTVKTVKNHVNRIFAKLGATGRVDAVLIWQSARDRPPLRHASRPAPRAALRPRVVRTTTSRRPRALVG